MNTTKPANESHNTTNDEAENDNNITNDKFTTTLINETIHPCTAKAKFTPRETEILALYDEALELDLEAALLRATASLSAPDEEEGGAAEGEEDNGLGRQGAENGWYMIS